MLHWRDTSFGSDGYIPTVLSLAVIALVLAAVIVASVVRARRLKMRELKPEVQVRKKLVKEQG
jgi:hypothetical protein